MAIQFKKAEIVEKYAIEKKTLKIEANMKKVNNQTAKNLQTTIEKLQTIKRTAALLLIDRHIIKKHQNNEKLIKLKSQKMSLIQKKSQPDNVFFINQLIYSKIQAVY